MNKTYYGLWGIKGERWVTKPYNTPAALILYTDILCVAQATCLWMNEWRTFRDRGKPVELWQVKIVGIDGSPRDLPKATYNIGSLEEIANAFDGAMRERRDDGSRYIELDDNLARQIATALRERHNAN